MLPLISVTTQFLLVALVVTAVALGATIGFLFVRARRAETDGRLSDSERDELRQRDTEIAAIRARIEEIYERQQGGSETQLAVVHQRLASLQHHLKARTRQIEGLQSQLQYEMQRREAEMNELRGQLQEAVQTVRGQLAAPAPSLSEATSSKSASGDRSGPAPFPADELLRFNPEIAPSHDLDGASDDEDIMDETVEMVTHEPDSAPEDQVVILGEAASSEPDTGSEDFEWTPVELNFNAESTPQEEEGKEVADEAELDDPFGRIEVRPETRGEGTDGARETDDLIEQIELDGLDELLRLIPDGDEEQDEPLAEAMPEEPASNPVDESEQKSSSETFGDLIQWTSLDEYQLDDPPSAPSPSRMDSGSEHPMVQAIGGDGMPDVAATAVPLRETNGKSDDLTVLPMIDQRRQAQINALGVHSIEEIARWSRADARRVVEHLQDVSEEEIMNKWIFAAQTILFDRYQAELRGRGETN